MKGVTCVALLGCYLTLAEAGEVPKGSQEPPAKSSGPEATPKQERKTWPHFDTKDPGATRWEWMMEEICAEQFLKYDWEKGVCVKPKPPT